MNQTSRKGLILTFDCFIIEYKNEAGGYATGTTPCRNISRCRRPSAAVCLFFFFAECLYDAKCFQKNLKTIPDVTLLISVSDANVHFEATILADRRMTKLLTRLEYPIDLQNQSFMRTFTYVSTTCVQMQNREQKNCRKLVYGTHSQLYRKDRNQK
jgi:hypothetical protein